ncbi:hypothetical protein [Micrococcus luteus]|uniref:hypothetical protein n=1 Tax=Micrococcus luteus TaxID=1270 RepID=UPI0019D193DE|nr:hypothetical protein [Micrococcus luteus]MBN6751056.1 hypothetical protein [Micrococcus luteus]MBN6760644.1 hypothetical protein [Micrococcus luteus]MBN6801340.1 hypothetical protein [Micrococcus luteus]MDT1990553.1 hypothetical protein [Micrococcus luteus]
MDPQVATLLAGLGASFLTAAGTLGATALSNRHAAQEAKATREREDERWKAERRDAQAAEARRRRQAAWDVVQDALLRAAEARVTCEALVSELESLGRDAKNPANAPRADQLAAQLQDLRVRMSANVAEFSKVAVALAPYGQPLGRDAEDLVNVVRAVHGGSTSLAMLSEEMQHFQASVATWLEKNREFELGTTPAQTAPNETHI